MSERTPEEQPSTLQDRSQQYVDTGNLEAHIIADMLRIEGITRELREFKNDQRETNRKLERYIVGIVGVTVTTLLSSVGALLFLVLK